MGGRLGAHRQTEGVSGGLTVSGGPRAGARYCTRRQGRGTTQGTASPPVPGTLRTALVDAPSPLALGGAPGPQSLPRRRRDFDRTISTPWGAFTFSSEPETLLLPGTRTALSPGLGNHNHEHSLPRHERNRASCRTSYTELWEHSSAPRPSISRSADTLRRQGTDALGE